MLSALCIVGMVGCQAPQQGPATDAPRIEIRTPTTDTDLTDAHDVVEAQDPDDVVESDAPEAMVEEQAHAADTELAAANEIEQSCEGGFWHASSGEYHCWSPDFLACNCVCVNQRWSVEHCGGCFKSCGPGESCHNGQCVCYDGKCGEDAEVDIEIVVENDSVEADIEIIIEEDNVDATDVNPEICEGFATRFWDCCKLHCGWQANVPNAMRPISSCDIDGQSLVDDWLSPSGCHGGTAYTCFDLAPRAVNQQLSYGFAATAQGDICGRCYQLDFTGESANAGPDEGSRQLKNKQMIVQIVNIGYDVKHQQFDILIPGGGVGAFNACSSQWDIPTIELGAQYGGFLESCKTEHGRLEDLAFYQECVRERCHAVFSDERGLQGLRDGCLWFVDWFLVADNPRFIYSEIECPEALIDVSQMDRLPFNDVSHRCQH